MPPVRRQDFVRKEMRMATLGNPGNTIAMIQKYQFVFQKKFGQNFLIDTHVLEKIIRAAEITDQDCVLEIGPGIGTMTQYLAEHARHVVAVEIDANLIPILGETLSGHNAPAYVAFMMVVICWYLMCRTALGLRVRSVGKSLTPVKPIALALSGFFASLGGLYMSMGNMAVFITGMTAAAALSALLRT